jgi:hypothetical protein
MFNNKLVGVIGVIPILTSALTNPKGTKKIVHQ